MINCQQKKTKMKSIYKNEKIKKWGTWGHVLA